VLGVVEFEDSRTDESRIDSEGRHAERQSNMQGPVFTSPHQIPARTIRNRGPKLGPDQGGEGEISIDGLAKQSVFGGTGSKGDEIKTGP
jgi:hypothetical protein